MKDKLAIVVAEGSVIKTVLRHTQEMWEHGRPTSELRPQNRTDGIRRRSQPWEFKKKAPMLQYTGPQPKEQSPLVEAEAVSTEEKSGGQVATEWMMAQTEPFTHAEAHAKNPNLTRSVLYATMSQLDKEKRVKRTQEGRTIRYLIVNAGEGDTPTNVGKRGVNGKAKRASHAKKPAQPRAAAPITPIGEGTKKSDSSPLLLLSSKTPPEFGATLEVIGLLKGEHNTVEITLGAGKRAWTAVLK